MGYAPIEIDRKALTIMGVRFRDDRAFSEAIHAIGSNMFEGFKPTPKGVAIIRDYLAGDITQIQLVRLTRKKAYV